MIRPALRAGGLRNDRRGPSGRSTPSRAAFTLIELLIVMAIIALMAAAVLFAMYGVLDEAKADRTETLIKRVDQAIQDRWDSYLTRPVPLNLPQNANPNIAASVRLAAIRDLMRMELPDRVTDIQDNPVVLYNNPVIQLPVPALLRGYRRRCLALLGPSSGNPNVPDYTKWSTSHEGAECLFLILSAMNEEGTNAVLDFVSPSEIGDVDNDGMPEILDAWGNPVQFLRWAPGFYSDRQMQNAAAAPDPFDPMKVDPRWSDSVTGNEPYLLYPLVFSAGSDGLYDINTDGTVRYSQTSPIRNDCWFGLGNAAVVLIGTPTDANADGKLSYSDNIHNHLLELK